MNIGLLRVELHISESRSLKDKRKVLKRLKDRLRNNFNASVAETAEMNKWQKGVLAIAVVSNDRKHLSGYLDGIMNFIVKENMMTVLDYTVEML